MVAWVGGIKYANGCFVVTMHLGGLEWDAAPLPLANSLLQVIAIKTFHDEANVDFGFLMGNTVSGLEGLSSEGHLNNMSGNAS